MAESQLMFTRCPLIVMVAPAFRFRVVCASTFVSAVLFTSTLFALEANFASWRLDDYILARLDRDRVALWYLS